MRVKCLAQEHNAAPRGVLKYIMHMSLVLRNEGEILPLDRYVKSSLFDPCVNMIKRNTFLEYSTKENAHKIGALQSNTLVVYGTKRSYIATLTYVSTTF